MKNEESFEDFMKRLLGEKGEEGVEKNPPQAEGSGEEKPDQVHINVRSDNGIITLVEPDEESGLMFQRQQQYEAELEELDFDDPRKKFAHNFLQSNYLPVVEIREDSYVEPDFHSVAEEMCEIAYDVTSSGSRKLNQGRFCRIWKERFNYVYSGNILTPNGAISPEWFRHELMKMIFEMCTESQNLDLLVDRLYKTYVTMYRMDAYMEYNKIPFKNGDLVLNEDKKGFTFYIGRRSPTPYRFDYDFNNIPNCYEPDFPNFRGWLDGLFDVGDQYTIKQMLGYLLIPSNEAQEAFFIIGKGGSGKSILTDCIIPKMLGNAYFPISIGSFFNNQFQVGTSEGKLCMVDDDIGEANLTKSDSGRFKNFVTAKMIQIEHKYCNPTMAVNSARIVCSGNHMISSNDKTDGFTRRLHPIYAKPRTIEKVDRHFPQKVEKEIELIVLWALEGLLEMFKNGGVPYNSEKTNTNFEYYTESQKWEEQFINDCFCYKEKSVTYSQEVRAALQEWVKDNSEMCGDGSLDAKFKAVASWLRDEGLDKNGYIYKRGIRRGDKYNARGYINMALREPVVDPTVFINEHGGLSIRVKRKKPEDQDRLEKEED